MRDQFVEATSKCQTGDSRLDEIDCQHMSRVYNANLLAKCSLNLIVQLNSMVMKLLLEIKEDKAQFVLGLLRRLPYVRVKPFTPFQFEVLDSTRNALEELKLIKEGKLEARDADELLNEILCKDDARV
jgi:hypothetical protein